MAADPSLLERLEPAVEKRLELIDERHEQALRLFNGFYEGCPELVADLYGRTLVLYNHADPPEAGMGAVGTAVECLRDCMQWIDAGILKTRCSIDPVARNGVPLFGDRPARRVLEHGVWYAVDLTLNRDASFYLDTRNLREWAVRNLSGKTVLNAFAYTGSLGVAARAGGASRVLQVDRNRNFLSLAKASCSLNGWPIRHADFMADDFFRVASRMRRRDERFDCVFLDPPFFAESARGTVDMEHAGGRLLNKARPLVAEGGWLVVVNNALYLGGRDWMHTLEEICAGGRFSVEMLVPVPPDVAGWPETTVRRPPADPSPFNHATKIAILRCI